MSANGPVYVLSGATSDIGRAIVLRLVRSGRRVAALGRTRSALENLRKQAPELIQTCCVDLMDDAAVTECSSRIIDSGQSMAALIHCAGVHYAGAIATASVAEMDHMYRANVHAPYLLSQLLIPSLARARGHVVFVNSTAGLRARPNLAGFSSSQHSLRVLADALREEVNKQGIRVTSIYLGRTATRRIARVFKAEHKAFDPGLLLQPDDVAETVFYALTLPATAEVVDLTTRPAVKFN